MSRRIKRKTREEWQDFFQGVLEGIAYSIYEFELAREALTDWRGDVMQMVDVLIAHEADPQFIYSYIIDYFTTVHNLDPEDVRRILDEALCL